MKPKSKRAQRRKQRKHRATPEECAKLHRFVQGSYSAYVVWCVCKYGNHTDKWPDWEKYLIVKGKESIVQENTEVE